MAKKFYDIIPPREKPVYFEPAGSRKNIKKEAGKSPSFFKIDSRAETKKRESSIEKVVVSPRGLDLVFQKKKEKKITGFRLGKFLLFFVLFLLLVAVPGLFLFSKTEIKIWLQTRILTFQERVVIDLNSKEIDLENKIIPGEIFKDQKFASQDFSVSGRTLKEEKAKGIITVYNNYSVDSQPLLANTRFVSTDGKMFRSVKKEVIAGGKYEKGKFISGETNIEVAAAEPGEDYNIPPSTFSIPGFSGTPKYTAFYGKSFSAMAGGFKDEVSQVIQDDLDKAKSILSEKLARESRDFLKTALPQGFFLLEESITQEIIEEKYSAELGTTAESFNLELKIISEGLMFKESDIKDFAENIINSNISPDERIQEGSLEIKYSLEAKSGEEDSLPQSLEKENQADNVFLNLDIKARAYQDIDLSFLKEAVLGKSVSEAELFLKGQKEISKIEIINHFWRKKIPKNPNRVELKINF